MPKSREHGQGALYWVESRKMWRAVVDVGFDPETGKRLQKARMSKTKDGAVKKLNTDAARARLAGDGARPLHPGPRACPAWLEDVTRRGKPHTLANYRSHVKRRSFPRLGDRIATDLTPADVRRMHAAMRKTGVGDSTVSGAHRTLVTLLEYARAERISRTTSRCSRPRGVRVPGRRGRR